MHEDLNDELFLSLADVFNDLANVPHVVDVLELGRCGQQFFGDLLEDLEGGEDDGFGVGAFGGEEGVEDLEGGGGAGRREHQGQKLPQEPEG